MWWLCLSSFPALDKRTLTHRLHPDNQFADEKNLKLFYNFNTNLQGIVKEIICCTPLEDRIEIGKDMDMSMGHN